MKRRLFVYFVTLVILVLFSNFVLAEYEKEVYPENILNVYRSEDKYFSLGIKHNFKDGIYLGGNAEYQNNNGVGLELNSVYMVPDIFIWDFYGGGGLKINTKHKDLKPYLLLGEQFIFLFSEVKYYFSSEEEVEFRSGFKFQF